MNKHFLATLATWLGISSAALGQAQLQVIHNCADPAAAIVDVYVNGTLALDDFNFREATPFLTLPSGVTIDIGIAPANSSNANDTLVNFPVQLIANEKYVAVASGVLSPASFTANPDGIGTGFQLLISDGMRTSSATAGQVDLRVLHGSTDAPAVDVIAQGVGTLVNDAAYTDVTGYISVPPVDVLLDITPANNNTIVVGTYAAPLSILADSAAIVFASGFLDPAANNNGAAFGLFAALPSGLVVPLTPVGLARLQVIHNCADPAAAQVDVYLNGSLLLNDFGFRTATPYIDVTSNIVQNIGIAPGNSLSAADTLVNIPITLSSNGTYVAIASGVLDPSLFAANPDGINTGFQLNLFDNMQESALNPANTEFAVLHGATDAPAVDVYARNVAQLVDDAAYGAITSYLSVPASDYILDITPAAGSPILASYSAPLSSLAGQAFVAFASGFLDPAQNNNGPSFGLYAALADGTVIPLEDTATARLQIIHNSADPAAAQVDIYVNGSILLDDFAFRSATSYIHVPAETTLDIGIAPGNSTSANDTLVNIPVVLSNNGTYVAIANGVLAPSSFALNPNGVSTGFQLLLHDGMREAALTAGDVDFRVLHGATDAPAVDVKVRNGATLVNGAQYTDFTAYISVPSNDYLLDICAAGTSTIVASYTAPLTAIPDLSAVLFASGFLDPSQNNNGEAFGLFAALPDGTVVPFTKTSVARAQIIHNCADPAADSVDIYINGSLALDNFAFRSATPYIDVTADTAMNIGIAPKTSNGVNDTLVSYNVTLNNGETYVAIASGVLNPANFVSNPNGVSTGFQLLLFNGMREAAVNPLEVDFRALHGVTDAPAVDIIAQNIATLVSGAQYTDFTSYINVPAGDYVLDVNAAGTSTTVASFNAPLSGVPGVSGVVFASGFLNPAQNQSGQPFGLFAALSNGTVVPFPPVSAPSTARLQVIHNCADPLADSVDIYVGSILAVDNFAFRTATPFADVPAGQTFTVGVAPKNSTSVNDTLISYDIQLTGGETYVAVASGVLTPSNFAVNPDGRPTGFSLILQNQMQETAQSPGNVDFRVLHGSTDAPTVDIIETGSGILVDDAAYTDVTPYLSAPAAAYTLLITPGNNNSVVVAAYIADISTLGGSAGLVFASGFLDPSTNQNGPAFGLFAALPNGTVIPFQNVTGIEDNEVLNSVRIYPNPTNDVLNISMGSTSDIRSMNIVDLSGKIVATPTLQFNGQTIRCDVNELAAGMYMLNIMTDDGVKTERFSIVR